MAEIRYVGHDVVIVSSLDGHAGPTMLKVDGMKMSVFSYASGYFVTFNDYRLSVHEFAFAVRSGDVVYTIDGADVVVGALMLNGVNVYINILCINGKMRNKPRLNIISPMLEFEHLPTYLRSIWRLKADITKNLITLKKLDGIICVTTFRTLSMKVPTVDLLYLNGSLYTTESGASIKACNRHVDLYEGAVYEMTVNSNANPNIVTLTSPVQRLMKRRPNKLEIVKRAFISIYINTRLPKDIPGRGKVRD